MRELDINKMLGTPEKRRGFHLFFLKPKCVDSMEKAIENLKIATDKTNKLLERKDRHIMLEGQLHDKSIQSNH